MSPKIVGRCYGCGIPIFAGDPQTYVNGNPVHKQTCCIEAAEQKEESLKKLESFMKTLAHHAH